MRFPLHRVGGRDPPPKGVGDGDPPRSPFNAPLAISSVQNIDVISQLIESSFGRVFITLSTKVSNTCIGFFWLIKAGFSLSCHNLDFFTPFYDLRYKSWWLQPDLVFSAWMAAEWILFNQVYSVQNYQQQNSIWPVAVALRAGLTTKQVGNCSELPDEGSYEKCENYRISLITKTN